MSKHPFSHGAADVQLERLCVALQLAVDGAAARLSKEELSAGVSLIESAMAQCRDTLGGDFAWILKAAPEPAQRAPLAAARALAGYDFPFKANPFSHPQLHTAYQSEQSYEARLRSLEKNAPPDGDAGTGTGTAVVYCDLPENCAVILQARANPMAEAFHKTLSLGAPMDQGGRHWILEKSVAPEQRLAFALAVYFMGGSYVMVSADRGILSVERVAQRFADLMKARRGGSYQAGHAYARLYAALGFGPHDTAGFTLIDHDDLACVEGFVKGYADGLRLAPEADPTGAPTGGQAATEGLLANLRHFINDHLTVFSVGSELLRSGAGPGCVEQRKTPGEWGEANAL